MKKILSLTFIVAMAIISNSCATIFGGAGRKPVVFNSEPPGATVQDRRGNHLCITPCVAHVMPNAWRSQTGFTMSHEGRSQSILLANRNNPLYLANLGFLIGAPIAMVVDISTGAAWRDFPNNSVHANFNTNMIFSGPATPEQIQNMTAPGAVSAPIQVHTPQITNLPQEMAIAQTGTSAQRSEARSSPFRLRIEDPQIAIRQQQEEFRRMQEAWEREMEQMRATLGAAQRVSEAIHIEVEPTIELAVAEDGGQEMNLNVNFLYETRLEGRNVQVDAAALTDDFPPGAYMPATSRASMLLLQFIQNKMETELAQYLTPGARVTIRITGETCGSPIRGRIPYRGEFGDFTDVLAFVNGDLANMTVIRQTGITSNAQLAFLRAQGVRDFLENNVETLQETNNRFQIFAVENEGRGNQYRRISIEMTIHGALNRVIQEPTPQEQQQIAENFVSSIQRNIPQGNRQNDDFFALIIGNEIYTNPWVSNVPFAINDAQAFKAYARTTLGIPERNIFFVENGTRNEIDDAVERLTRLLRISGSSGRAIVYYAGHGIPNPETRGAYIIPTDANPERFGQMISLNSLYRTLGATGADLVMVVLDACFSGVQRNGNMILEGTRAVRIRPQEERLGGNLIVVSATNGHQVAHPFRDQRHGLFTFFFLQTLQESGGNITLGEWLNTATRIVERESAFRGIEQTPSITVSPAIENRWTNIRF